MNILILNWRDPKNPKSGGAEYVTHEHAVAWVNNGHNVTWFASSFKNCKKEETIDNVKIIRKGISSSVYLYASIFYFLNRKKIDFIVDEIHGLPFFTPLYSRKNKVAFIHEVADEIWNIMYPFPINVLGRFLEGLYFKIYKNVDFWTDAKSTIDDLEKHGINKEKCIAIPCPAKNKSLSKIPLKEKIPTFIFVSRVVKMKGVEDVIKAFFYIIKEVKNAQLWIVGDGDEKYIKCLKKTINSYSIPAKVKFFGKVSEKKKLNLLKKSHLLLHASIKEGWGLVVIEAASQATPSVVYNVNGLRDSVKNNRTGVVLKVNSPKEMARESMALLKDKKKYRRFQENALFWSKTLNWNSITKQSLDLINNICRKN